MHQSSEETSSLYSFQIFDSKHSRLAKRRMPQRVLETIQRWTLKMSNYHSSNSSHISLGDCSIQTLKSSNGNDMSIDKLDEITVGEHEESIMSEVIRNRKQLESLIPNSSNSLSPNTYHDSGVFRSYIQALEIAELENRTLIHHPKSSNKQTRNNLKLQNNLNRISSVYNPYRKMRLLDPISYILIQKNADDESRLGFANLPEQMHRKAVKKGFNFTLMVVGESGLGKSTLINSLFVQDLYKDHELLEATDRIESTTKIEKRQIELDERGIKLRLTVVDTPGFGDAVNCVDCWKPIEDYIDSTFEQYFKDECGLNRKNIHDHRVHCCLYFISPYGHRLRQIDVEFMRRLQHKVNIVPVIAKADAFTANELVTFKERIRADFDKYQIDIYRLPECDSDEEEEIKRLDKEIKAVLPFSVIGSNCVIDLEGNRRTRGRQYPWGSVEVENSRHCDFTKLRIFLLKTHMQDLKDMTLDVHYENYRAKYITERMSKRQTDRREGPSTGALARLEKEGGSGFEAIVDQDSLLKQKEEELQRMQNLMSKMQEQLKRKTPAVSSASGTLTNGGPSSNQISSIQATGPITIS